MPPRRRPSRLRTHLIIVLCSASLIGCGGCDASPSAGAGGSGPSVGPADVAADQSVLEWNGTTALDANGAVLPSSFAMPDEHACAMDPTRQYIGELFFNGTSDIEVNYHWAPVVPGPDPTLPTLGQPEISIAGTTMDVDDSTDDVLADHPFGVDTNADVDLDSDFAFASFNPDDPNNALHPIHTEIELRTLPRDALGYMAAAGDRILQRGAWILDCGHPPYGAEMHPPSFYAAARAKDAKTTEAMAFFVPYRSSLLFTQDVTLAGAFDDEGRFLDKSVETFENALITAVEVAVIERLPNITSHALMEANHFDAIDFAVCAPLPRPKGAKLAATWRFTARTGVTIGAEADDASGCVHVVATMSSAYAPAPLAYADAPWPWSELSASASAQAGQPVDVRQEIMKIVQMQGIDPTNVPALKADHPPVVDAYPALHTRSGADQDTPIAIDDAADDQPFPFYGRVRAQWQ